MQKRYKIETIVGQGGSLDIDFVASTSGAYVSLYAHYRGYMSRISGTLTALYKQDYARLHQLLTRTDEAVKQLHEKRSFPLGPELKCLHLPVFLNPPTRNVIEISLGTIGNNIAVHLVYRPHGDGYLRLFASGPDLRYRGIQMLWGQSQYNKLKGAVKKIDRLAT